MIAVNDCERGRGNCDKSQLWEFASARVEFLTLLICIGPARKHCSVQSRGPKDCCSTFLCWPSMIDKRSGFEAC